MDYPIELDVYTEMKRKCPITRQATVHVTIMALAGVVYLGVGGLAGFYIGKSCEYKLFSV